MRCGDDKAGSQHLGSVDSISRSLSSPASNGRPAERHICPHNFFIMPRFFDDYSNTYLTHDSAAGRKQQRRGWKFRENFKVGEGKELKMVLSIMGKIFITYHVHYPFSLLMMLMLLLLLLLLFAIS
jgi:hypothetical protein